MSQLPNSIKAVAYTGRRQAALIDWPWGQTPLEPDEVAGPTLASLISPGTELNYGYDVDRTQPGIGGYAAAFQIAVVGEAVTNLKPGDVVFGMGPHTSWQRLASANVVRVPASLSPQVAVFARLMSVSWSTLITTTARPADRVLIVGLGPVGNLAAQIFHAAGYSVIGVDPLETRRALAGRVGISRTLASVPVEDPEFTNSIALAVDCSGHEAAVLDACKLVRKRGEVVLVGVPWKKRANLSAFDLLHAVFHRYIVLRSGWEWELPMQPREFTIGSIMTNLAGAMSWLAERRVVVDGMYEAIPPKAAPRAYDDLFNQRGAQLSFVFDWKLS